MKEETGPGAALRNRISAVLPCLNEAESLPLVVPAVLEVADEVIVVDNGSDDNSAEIARGLGVTLVSEPRRGYGRTYRTGLPMAKRDVIATLDVDCTYPAAAIPEMAGIVLRGEADFVSGARFPLDNPGAMRLKNRLSNRFISWAASRLLNIRMRDLESGMWVFRRDILGQVLPETDGMEFSQDIKLNACLNPGLRFLEYHIPYSPRVGESKFHALRDATRDIKALWHYRKLRRSS
jgi:glycosyltransferase involved in cell wall biosynthesis